MQSVAVETSGTTLHGAPRVLQDLHCHELWLRFASDFMGFSWVLQKGLLGFDEFEASFGSFHTGNL